jgi:hypothetical protein
VALLAHGEQLFDLLAVHFLPICADLASGEVTALVQGADFYACPRTSPDGTK